MEGRSSKTALANNDAGSNHVLGYVIRILLGMKDIKGITIC